MTNNLQSNQAKSICIEYVYVSWCERSHFTTNYYGMRKEKSPEVGISSTLSQFNSAPILHTYLHNFGNLLTSINYQKSKGALFGTPMTVDVPTALD